MFFGLLLSGCGAPEGEPAIIIPDPIVRDLQAIKARDTLVVLTQFNSTSYFLYRGEPMGYEYDFLQAFAQEHDLYFKTIVVRNRDSLLVLLNEGVGDVIAARWTLRPEDSTRIGYTEPLYRTRPVVVQREDPLEGANLPPEVVPYVDSAAAAPPYGKTARNDTGKLPENPSGGSRGVGQTAAVKSESLQVQARLVTHPSQLTGKQVHVLEDTRFEDRLVQLSDALTGEIYVVEVDSGTAEMLMQDVAEERIDFTIGHENVAHLQESYYSNLVVLPTVDRPYEVIWAVRKNAPELREALDAWIEDHAGLENQLYERYFIDRSGYRERVADDYLTSETGRLSPYDSLFKQHAPQLGWDWRLLAAQAYQESRFDSEARSWAGAAGVLQLMPATARAFGVTDAYDPAQNVSGAARFLEWLDGYWKEKIADEQERLKFILASYNAGPGHVEDARRLAEKQGDDATVWEDVAYWLLRKSEQAVYSDPVVRYGFCRGLEPITYVARILDRFDHYRQFVEPARSHSMSSEDLP